MSRAVLDGGQWVPSVLQLLALHIPTATQRHHRNTLPQRPQKTALFAR